MFERLNSSILGVVTASENRAIAADAPIEDGVQRVHELNLGEIISEFIVEPRDE